MEIRLDYRSHRTGSGAALRFTTPLVHNNAADFDVIARVLNDCADRFPGVGQLILIGCSEPGRS